MAIIKFEKVLELNEINFVASIIDAIEFSTYSDIRDFRADLESFMKVHSIRDTFIIGSGSSHIWIKRVGEVNDNDRWAIITN